MRLLVLLLAMVFLGAATASAQEAGTRRPIASPLKPSASSSPGAAKPRASTFPARPPITTIEDEPEAAPVAERGGRFAPDSSFRSTIGDDEPIEAAEEEVAPLPARPRTSAPATTSAPRYSGAPATTSPATTSRNVIPNRTSVPAGRIASSASPATPISTPAEAASPVAEAILAQTLAPRAKLELPGEPLALAKVVERAGGSDQRIRAVQTYWSLVAKVAAYHDALDDRAMFQQINGQRLATHDRAALAAAQHAAEAAIRRAELDFVTAQHELAEIAHFTSTQSQALPIDVPLVSEYRTRFTTLYSGGAAPSGLRRLDRAIPYHLQDVRSRADSVVAAQQAVQAAAEAVSTGEATVANLVEIHQHLGRQRTAFHSAVYDYNAMIAEYALHVAPNHAPATVVGMLIKTKPATPSSRPAATARNTTGVRAASAEAEIADQQPALAGERYESTDASEFPSPAARRSIQYSLEDEPAEGEAEAVEEPATTSRGTIWR